MDNKLDNSYVIGVGKRIRAKTENEILQYQNKINKYMETLTLVLKCSDNTPAETAMYQAEIDQYKLMLDTFNSKYEMLLNCTDYKLGLQFLEKPSLDKKQNNPTIRVMGVVI